MLLFISNQRSLPRSASLNRETLGRNKVAHSRVELLFRE